MAHHATTMIPKPLPTILVNCAAVPWVRWHVIAGLSLALSLVALLVTWPIQTWTYLSYGMAGLFVIWIGLRLTRRHLVARCQSASTSVPNNSPRSAATTCRLYDLSALYRSPRWCPNC